MITTQAGLKDERSFKRHVLVVEHDCRAGGMNVRHKFNLKRIRSKNIDRFIKFSFFFLTTQLFLSTATMIKKKKKKSINLSIRFDFPCWVPSRAQLLALAVLCKGSHVVLRGKEAGKQMLRHSEWWQVRSRTMQPALQHNRPENQAEQQSAATQCSIPSRQTMSLVPRILGKGLRPASPAWWATRAVSRLRLHGATSPCSERLMWCS